MKSISCLINQIWSINETSVYANKRRFGAKLSFFRLPKQHFSFCVVVEEVVFGAKHSTFSKIMSSIPRSHRARLVVTAPPSPCCVAPSSPRRRACVVVSAPRHRTSSNLAHVPRGSPYSGGRREIWCLANGHGQWPGLARVALPVVSTHLLNPHAEILTG